MSLSPSIITLETCMGCRRWLLFRSIRPNNETHKKDGDKFKGFEAQLKPWDIYQNMNPPSPACQVHQGCVIRSVWFLTILGHALSSQVSAVRLFARTISVVDLPTADLLIEIRFNNKNPFIFKAVFKAQHIRKAIPKASDKQQKTKIDPKIYKTVDFWQTFRHIKQLI